MSRCCVHRLLVKKLLKRDPREPGLPAWTPSTAWATGYKASTAGSTLLGAYRYTLTLVLTFSTTSTKLIHSPEYNSNPKCNHLYNKIYRLYISFETGCDLQHLNKVMELFTTLIFTQLGSYLQMPELFRASGSVTVSDTFSHNCCSCHLNHDNVDFSLLILKNAFLALSLFHQSRSRSVSFSTSHVRPPVFLCLIIWITNWSLGLYLFKVCFPLTEWYSADFWGPGSS